MSFGPESLRGGPRTGLAGQIDYRLARNSLVREYKKGRVSRLDVCDAHPELLRAARGGGQASGRDCPICESSKLVLVSFAFGDRLPPNGRCVTSRQDIDKLSRRPGEIAFYVVEVCLECSWNHLARSFVTRGRRS